MSTLEKLKALQEQRKNQVKQNNMSEFSDIVAINVGCEPTEHFPKLKDDQGRKLKDENGSDQRAKISDGWTYTFAEFGTAKTIKVVLPRKIDIGLLVALKVSGFGYDIKQAGMIFIEQNGKIELYDD